MPLSLFSFSRSAIWIHTAMGSLIGLDMSGTQSRGGGMYEANEIYFSEMDYVKQFIW